MTFDVLLLGELISPSFWTPAISIFEKMLRPTLVYVFLVVLLRIFGKRELAQLNPFDLVVLLSLSNTVQNAIIGQDDSLTGGLIGAATLCGVNYLVVRFLFRHRRLDQIIEGKPTVLVRNGEIQHDALQKELLTESELATMAHRQGFSGLSEIEQCTIEPGGEFSIEGKHPRQADRYHAELISRLERLERLIEKRLEAEAKSDE